MNGDTLKIGDTIRRSDAYDMIETMHELAGCGIDTEFMYEKDGIEGLWLKVIGRFLEERKDGDEND